jgi:hypothetical protein
MLRDEGEVLDGLVEAELQGRAEIRLRRLAALPAGVGRLVVQRLADGVGGRPTPGAARRLEDILALRESGTAHLDLPGGVRASVVEGVLRFDRTPEITREP